MIKRLNYLIATGLYSGYSPIAPGTAGSALGFILFWIIPGFRGYLLLIGSILLFFIGVVTATQIEKYEGKKDSGLIVVDEIVGMWLSIVFLPKEMHFIWLIGAFFLFRIFDIIKPFPADRSQKLPGGWGVMIDDVFAGIYTNLVLQGLYYLTGVL